MLWVCMSDSVHLHMYVHAIIICSVSFGKNNFSVFLFCTFVVMITVTLFVYNCCSEQLWLAVSGSDNSTKQAYWYLHM